MKTLLLLPALLLALASPAHALTEEANHYTGTDQRSQYADPDDGEEQLGDAPAATHGQSGREQQLLNGGAEDHGQTYGFGGYDNSRTRGNSYGGSSTYYGFH